ncbi:c-type cytochrome [Novispirillum sp. DQ9]|uniref:c-type cytochrome n=1 Tax=Novispirillum sp. DQ9 TaxID=3398612 RepID=UPI003C7E7C11
MTPRHKRMVFGIALPLVVVAVVGLLGVGYMVRPGDDPAQGLADPTDAAQVAAGKEVYARHCASCHGADLAGETADWRTRKASGSLPAPPHDASGHTWHHPDQQLFAITKRGIAPFAPEGYVSDMPAFGGVLSDAEIWAVLAYIKSTWPPDALRSQQARTEQATKAGQGG